MSLKKRLSRWLTFTALTLAAMMTLNLCATSVVRADYIISYTDDEGWTHVLLLDKDGDLKSQHIYDEKNKHVVSEYYDDDGNPNPDDGTTVPGDYDSMMDLAKQHGGEELQVSFEKTPVGRYLGLKGIGVGPLHNPGDGDDQGGLSPGGLDIRDPIDEAEEALAGGRIGSADFSPNGGSVGEQLADMVRGGREGNDNDDDSARPSDGGLWEEDMLGPPEYVNPPPEEQGFVLLPATVGEFGDGSPWPWWHTDASAALDPQPIPWAVFGGAVGPIGRPGGVSSANVR